MPDLSTLLTSSDPLIHSLGWALIHSLWQGVLVAALLGLLFRAIPNMSNALRYHLACVALFGLVVLISLTGTYHASTYHSPTPVFEPPLVTGQLPDISTSIPTASPVLATGVSEPAVTGSATGLATQIEGYLPWAVLVWAVGFVLISCRMFYGWLTVRRLCVRQASPIAASIQTQVSGLCETLRIRRAVRVLESGLAATPMVVGWVRPVVLLPATTVTGLTSQQLQAVLAHELAHVLRNDYLVNLLQCLIETLLFYHPAVWWISRTIRAERERCCDDIAVGVSGDRVDYAKALLRIAETAPPYHGRVSPASQGGDLSGRIRRLLGQEPHGTRPRNAAGLWTALASLCVVTALVMSAQAGEDSSNQPAGGSTSTTSVSAIADNVGVDSSQPTKKRIIEIPYQKLMAGDPKYNIVIRPGDIIKVSSEASGFVYLGGEVNRPGAYNITGNKGITLKQLIVSGGGIKKKSQFVKLVRRVGQDATETLHFSLDDIFDGWAQDAFLAPNDLIQVSSEPGPEDEQARERRRLREQIEPLRAKMIELSVRKEEVRREYGEGHRLHKSIDDQLHSLQQKLVETLTLLTVDPASIDTTILPAPEPPSIPNATQPLPSDLEISPALSRNAKPGDRVHVAVSSAESKSEHTSFIRVLDTQGRLSLPGIPVVNFVGRPVEDIKAEILRKMQSLPDYRQTNNIIIDLPDYSTFAALGPTVPRPGQHTLPHAGFSLIEALAQIGGLPEDSQTILVIRQEPHVNGD